MFSLLKLATMDEKSGTKVQTQTSELSTATHDAPGHNEKSLDQAYWFIEESRDVADEGATVDLENFVRKSTGDSCL